MAPIVDLEIVNAFVVNPISANSAGIFSVPVNQLLEFNWILIVNSHVTIELPLQNIGHVANFTSDSDSLWLATFFLLDHL